MTPGQLRDRLRELGATITLDGDGLAVDASRGALTPELRSEIRQHKPCLLKIVQAEAELASITRRVWEIMDAADSSESHGATEAAEQQRAEAIELADTEGYAALERLEALTGANGTQTVDEHETMSEREDAA